MTLKNAKMIMDDFYGIALRRITERGRHLYDDGVFQRFNAKCDAIVTALIYCNTSNVWEKGQKYQFELEERLQQAWQKRLEETA